MRDLRKIGRRLLFLPTWVTIILTIFSAIAIAVIFVYGWETHPLACICYVMAFYTLVVLCIYFYKLIPRGYKKVKTKLHENEYSDKYLTDDEFKTKVGLYCSLAINLLYVVVNAISGIVYRTHWFGIFAVYYGLIALMRFLLVDYVKKNTMGDNYLGELKRVRLCAYILLMVNLVLSGVVLMMSYLNKGFYYQGFLIYVMALYTFYITTVAIIDMIKYRKCDSPAISMTKVIKMTSAMFSMLFLETAMFAQFGENTSLETKKIMIMATGAGISLIVVIMAFRMIVETSRKIKENKK